LGTPPSPKQCHRFLNLCILSRQRLLRAEWALGAARCKTDVVKMLQKGLGGAITLTVVL
jgi:hypothetical protein